MSTTASSRPTGRDAVRGAVIDAAGRLFAARGPAASLRDIAAAANVDLRLIPRHFGNKDGLLHAVLDDYEGHDAAIVVRTDDVASALRMLFERSHADGQHIRLLAWLALTDQPRSLANHHGVLRRLSDRAANDDERLVLLGALALVYGWTIFGDPLLRAFDLQPTDRLDTELGIGDLLDWLLRSGTAGAIAALETGRHGARRPARPRDGSESTAPASTTEVATGRPGAAPNGRDGVRQAILTAASRQFATAGVAASLRNIAADARVNLGLIHRHFGNKDDLLRAVIAAPTVTGLDTVANAPDVASALRQLFESRPTSGDYSRIIAFLLLAGVPTQQFIDHYPAISAMRSSAPSPDQQLRLLAGFALAHGWTVFGASFLDAVEHPITARDDVRRRIGGVIQHLVAAPTG